MTMDVILGTIIVLSTIGNFMCAKILMDEGFLSHPFWTRSIRSLLLIPPFAMAYLMISGLVEFMKEVFGAAFKIIASYLTKRTDI